MLEERTALVDESLSANRLYKVDLDTIVPDTVLRTAAYTSGTSCISNPIVILYRSWDSLAILSDSPSECTRCLKLFPSSQDQYRESMTIQILSCQWFTIAIYRLNYFVQSYFNLNLGDWCCFLKKAEN
ncbi:hypothetical protein TNIN_394501 [Trichonephila inaurata madagascariensis]|uniref:Uncharacterized protein n=1 Tax=Trichonephila inaurata madagascariensis TaxID=2747483 RepID=A0A8X6JS94_9ARAC|nr:hypothetical protein TNIN_394501 [Trichonephila inaurata madagascariensis]